MLSQFSQKKSTNILKNYRPIITTCGNIFGKYIRSYVEYNNILSKSYSGFRKDDCISQLPEIIHEIYSSFDAYPSLEVSLRTYLKPLIEIDMKVYYKSLNLIK